MAKTAILSVRILGDAKGAVDAMGQAEGRASKLGGVLKGLGGAALGAATIAGGALIGLGVAGVKAAGDLEQSVGAVDTVFKDQAGIMHGYADDAATALGLTKNEYNELATVIGTQLKNGGTAMDELGGKTNELMTLGADLASMFGGTTTDAVDALSSALKGERDPIERYGVSLNQAAIDARAAELGFSKVGGALSAEAQQAATLSLIMDQTADAQGNFGRETGTFAGQVSILTSQWGNFVSQIGTLLLPILTSLLSFITGSIMPGLQQFADVIGPHISGAIEQVTPFLTGLLESFTSVAGGAGPLQAMFAALQPALQGFGSAIASTLPMVSSMVTAMLPHLMSIGQSVLGLIPTLLSVGQTILPLIIGAVTSIMPLIAQAAGTILPAVIGIVQRLLPIVQSIAEAVIPAVVGALQTLIPTILQIVPPIVSIVNSIIDVLGPAIEWLLPLVTGIFGGLVTQIQGAIQIVVAIFESVAALLRGDFSGAWTALQGVVDGVMTFISGLIQQSMAVITNITGMSMGQIRQFFTDGFNNIVTTVTSKISEFMGKVREIPGQITSALGNLGSLLTQAGKDLIQGLINGVGSMGKALKDKASGLATGAVDSIKGALGIASPSRVMMQVGKWTGEGLIRGVERMQRGAGRAMAGLVTVPDAPEIPLSASGRRGGGGAVTEQHVHVHIEGAFVGSELSLAREIERLLDGRQRLIGGA